MDVDSDYAKSVRQVGIKDAVRIMKEKGVVYDGDFTVDHRTDPAFSTPNHFLHDAQKPVSPHPVESYGSYSSGYA